MKSLVMKHGPKNWSFIASHLPGRIGKQCRERWMNHLDSNVKKGDWEAWEDQLIVELQHEYGNKWAQIAKHLPHRTDNSVKNRFNSTIKRGLRRQMESHTKRVKKTDGDYTFDGKSGRMTEMKRKLCNAAQAIKDHPRKKAKSETIKSNLDSVVKMESVLCPSETGISLNQELGTFREVVFKQSRPVLEPTKHPENAKTYFLRSKVLEHPVSLFEQSYTNKASFEQPSSLLGPYETFTKQSKPYVEPSKTLSIFKQPLVLWEPVKTVWHSPSSGWMQHNTFCEQSKTIYRQEFSRTITEQSKNVSSERLGIVCEQPKVVSEQPTISEQSRTTFDLNKGSDGSEVVLKQVPLDQVPFHLSLKEVSLQKDPLEHVPVEHVPMEQIPLEQTPLEQITLEETPLTKTPMEQKPEEQRTMAQTS
eukprot:TRINITY_DN6134_c1_g1_i2.p1 TRINITY_DN6134_c1_g1~~TRINITY_DN6134_c1_g1_i2.p1  ORF type:complete len:419 (-),score=74.31 TRINITY_DN6134_c1_g1_i2:22-1278(-)